MGGLVTNPPTPVEAPEYPPENAFDIQSFANQVLKVCHDAGLLQPSGAAKVGFDPGWLIKEILAGLETGAEGFASFEKFLLTIVTPILKVLLKVVLAILQPGMDLGATMTNEYVKAFVGSLGIVARGASGQLSTEPPASAQGLYDRILAPLAGISGAVNPQNSGAGEKNAQYALGSIVAIHLTTWVINIISNVTGIGVLKFINSFDNVITGGMNARGLGRVAMKPYLTKFMADPLTRDLNVRLPLDKLSAATLMKSYIRGSLTRDGLVSGMRGLGFDEGVTEQVLMDTVKHLGMSELVWLVNSGAWTKEMAWDDLKQQGYPEQYCPVVFAYAQTSLQRSILHAMADDLVSAVKNHTITGSDLKNLLAPTDLTQNEVDMYATRANILEGIYNRLSLSQVKSLFAESLVDLDYVLNFLEAEGYSPTDADLLALLEFTKKEDRNQRIADLAERRRVAAEAKKKSDALLAISQATRAAKYGIPWPPP